MDAGGNFYCATELKHVATIKQAVGLRLAFSYVCKLSGN